MATAEAVREFSAETKALGRPTKLAWAEVASWNASYAAVTQARDEISLFGDAKTGVLLHTQRFAHFECCCSVYWGRVTGRD